MEELPEEAGGWSDDERERADALLDGHAVVVNVRKNGPHKHLVPWLQEQGLLTYVGHSGTRHSWPESDFASPFVKEAKTDREAMVRQDKSLIRIDVERWGPIATGGFPPRLATS